MKYNDDAVLAFETAFLAVIGAVATGLGFLVGIYSGALFGFAHEGDEPTYLVIFGITMIPGVLILLGSYFRWMAVVANVVIILMMGFLVPYWWNGLALHHDPRMLLYLGLGIAVLCIAVLLIGPAIRRAIKGTGDKENS